MNEEIKFRERLGALKMNLVALETDLRGFLLCCELQGRHKRTADVYKELRKLNEGDLADENSFTNYDDLKVIIKEFNKKFSEPPLDKDKITRIRDIMAHGRLIFEEKKVSAGWLFKFKKPKNGKTEVVIAEKFTLDWLNNSSNFIRKQLFKARRCVKNTNYASFL